jgi:hypothetical protein
MRADGGFWLTDPPGYHHQCDQCGFAAALHDEAYPRVWYSKKETK